MKMWFIVFCLVATGAIAPAAALAQSRDYLTDEEIELVREAQQIDQRISVLTRAIDRRFAALNINVGGDPPKKSEQWGPVPTGTRAELFFDIRRLLQKSVDDIDNIAERPDSMVIDPDDARDKKKPKSFADLFPKAVRGLAAAAARYRPALVSELDNTKDEIDKGPIMASIDLCDEIAAAVPKLSSAPTPPKKDH